jgi:tRNA (cytidine/uridine-2'-O-)-methyltransferase
MSADGPTPGPPDPARSSSPEVERARLHVVLLEPEIAGNTGGIGRSCVAAGASLWLVRPLGFHINDRNIRRAGLDYWPHLPLRIVDELDEVISHFGPDRLWWFSTKASRPYTSATFREGDALIFGPESRGLPPRLVAEAESRSRALRIPIRPEARSLNLSNAAAIALFEALRQIGS